MKAALKHMYQIGLEPVNQAVLPADAPRPEAGEVVFKCFRLACAGDGSAQTLLQQRSDFAGYCFVSVQPILKIVPGCDVPT